jgi:hypothetical protein
MIEKCKIWNQFDMICNDIRNELFFAPAHRERTVNR